MFGTHLSRMGSVHRLGLVTRAIGILRKYGTDAHVYLPGVGTVSGLTAGNYLDSAGVTAASVDNPVGLSLDALQAMTMGSELVTNGTNPTVTTSWSATGVSVAAVSSEFQVTRAVASGWVSEAISVTVGKTYVLTATARKGTSNLAYLRVSNGANGVSLYGADAYTSSAINVPLTLTFVPAATTVYVNLGGQDLAGTVFYNNISVREIPGIHATQATTANKPILRLNSGKYSWQFDQSNDFLQTAITTGDVGWFCSGVTFTDSNSTLFCSGAGSAAQKGLWAYRVALSDMFVTLIGNGTALTSAAAISAPAGQPLVIAAGWDASNIFHSVNNTENTATRTGSASPSPANLRIGAYTDGTTYPLGGNMNIALVFDVLPTATERLTLKRWVGQISGVSL